MIFHVFFSLLSCKSLTPSFFLILRRFPASNFAATGRQESSETLFYIEYNKVDADASTRECTLLINHSLLLPPVTAEVFHDCYFNHYVMFCNVEVSFVILCHVYYTLSSKLSNVKLW